jgi:hypothetical protein
MVNVFLWIEKDLILIIKLFQSQLRMIAIMFVIKTGAVMDSIILLLILLVSSGRTQKEFEDLV